MCQRIVCQACGKPSFQGCGEHVEEVLGDVPVAQRCACASTGGSRGLFSRQ
ncbi:hypothetical protein [Nocardia sp. SYP-A9097]|uniref:hypothetical protein n=1 Tax=Nocardia sp. SYP-A9097 TaxID=2663237 RepID=UPI001E585182|nr:hypothetical protein [Nocardia sp. SYP-A9097]